MSNLRVGGLATGMDLESIVKDLMRIEQLKLDKLQQQKTRIQWQQEAYHNINKTFANFILEVQQAFGLAKAGSAGFVKQSVSSLSWVKTATSANETILTASARANAVAGTYTVEVEKLATNWSAASAVDIRDKIDSVTGNISFTIKDVAGEKEFTIDVSVNGVLDLSAVAKQINEEATKAGVAVAAHYDSGTGRFFLQTTTTGSKSGIIIEDNSVLTVDGETQPFSFIAYQGGNNSILRLQYLDANGQATAVQSGESYTGTDAVVHFGAARNLQFSSNQFTINNIDFRIQAVGQTTVTVDTDVDGVFNKIVDFINRYNELIDKVNNLLTEKVYRDYQPLTKEQKEEMTEKEIELWEEKAKSGLLNRDIYLSQTLQRLRSGLYEEIVGASGKTYRLYDFGITTERYVSGSMGGKLVVDETKLKEAIRNDVDSVLEMLFAQPESSATGQEARKHTGLVSRIFQDLTEGMKQIINKAGHGGEADLYRKVDSRMLLDFVVEQGSISFLQRDIAKLDERIISFQAQMLRKENQYWAQFTALEKAINQMNAQAMWLAQQLGGGR